MDARRFLRRRMLYFSGSYGWGVRWPLLSSTRGKYYWRCVGQHVVVGVTRDGSGNFVLLTNYK